jgi:hypothetical protein
MEVMVINNGTNSCQVFGFMNTAPGDVVTDTIAPATGAPTQGVTGVALAANAVGIFVCMTGQAGMTNGIASAQWRSKILA